MDPTLDVTDRERFLQELGEMSDGDSGRAVPVSEIAARLSLPQEQAILIAESLCTGLPGSAHHGLVQPARGEDFSEVILTRQGMELLDDAGIMPTS